MRFYLSVFFLVPFFVFGLSWLIVPSPFQREQLQQSVQSSSRPRRAAVTDESLQQDWEQYRAFFNLEWGEYSKFFKNIRFWPTARSVSIGTLYEQRDKTTFASLTERSREDLRNLAENGMTIENVYRSINGSLARSSSTLSTYLNFGLGNFSTLPLDELTIDGQIYSIANLFQETIKDKKMLFRNLSTAAKNELLKLSNQDIEARRVRTMLLEAYWDQLREMLNANFTALPAKVKNLSIGSRNINAFDVLFANRNLPFAQLQQQHQDFFQQAILVEEESWLSIVQIQREIERLIDEVIAQRIAALSEVFESYSGLYFDDLLIKDQIYNLNRFFLAKSTDEMSWEEAASADSSLMLAIDNEKVTLSDLKSALEGTDTNSEKLFLQMLKLVPSWKVEKKPTLLNYGTKNPKSLTFSGAKLFAEIGKKQQPTWQKVVTTSQKITPTKDQLSQTISLISSAIATKNNNHLLQLLLWNPLQKWLSTDFSSLIKQQIAIKKKTYDLTALFTQKTTTDWNQLNPKSRKVLKQLVDDKTTPLQLKTALDTLFQQQPKPVVKKYSNSLVIGLITIGSGIAVIGLVGFVNWLTKFRK